MERNKLVLIIFSVVLTSSMMFAQAGNNKMTGRSITIGFIGKSKSNPVFIAAYSGARVAAKEIGAKNGMQITIDWQTPQNENPKEQAAAIERLTQSGANGIAIACSDANVLTSPINKAVDLGIQVVCFDADAPKSRRLAYYGSDDAEMGRMMMDELANAMNEKGTIAILGGNKSAPNLQNRIRVILEELKKYPSMKLLSNGVYYNDEIPGKAAEVVNRAQKANPQIGGWAFVGGWPLFIKNGIYWEPGRVKIVACDALPDELEYIKSGHAQVLIAQGCFMWGYKSIELLVNKIVSNQTPTEVQIAAPLTRVTEENLNEWSLNWKKWLLKEAVNR
jgi:ribose transport system substrate-binding protein